MKPTKTRTEKIDIVRWRKEHPETWQYYKKK